MSWTHKCTRQMVCRGEEVLERTDNWWYYLLPIVYSSIWWSAAHFKSFSHLQEAYRYHVTSPDIFQMIVALDSKNIVRGRKSETASSKLADAKTGWLRCKFTCVENYSSKSTKVALPWFYSGYLQFNRDHFFLWKVSHTPCCDEEFPRLSKSYDKLSEIWISP